MVEHSDWWKAFDSVPSPRILVIEDVDRYPGTGALVGKTHAHVFKALRAVGIVTNGAVRDLPALEAMGMRVFSGFVSVSHAYTHIVSVGTTVRAGGLEISPGDVLHGDLHGLVQIPPTLIGQIPDATQRHQMKEQRIIDLCYSKEFSVSALRAAIENEDCLPGLSSNAL